MLRVIRRSLRIRRTRALYAISAILAMTASLLALTQAPAVAANNCQGSGLIEVRFEKLVVPSDPALHSQFSFQVENDTPLLGQAAVQTVPHNSSFCYDSSATLVLSEPTVLAGYQVLPGALTNGLYPMVCREGATYNGGSTPVSFVAGAPDYDVAAQELTIDLSAAPDQVACQVRNVPIAPTITIDKTVVGGAALDASFDFVLDQATAGSPFSEGDAPVALVPGTVYTLTEDAASAPGYDLTSLSCTGVSLYTEGTDAVSGAPNVTFTPVLGDEIECSATNEAQDTTLTLVKVVDGGTANQNDFTVVIDGQSAIWGSNIITPASPTKQRNHRTPLNYVAGSWSGDCDADGTVVGTGTAGEILQGDELTCTITNTFVPPTQGSITVVKAVTNDNLGDLDPSDFTLTISDVTSTMSFPGGGTSAFDPGNYTIGETAVAGYSLESISCVNAAGTVVSSTAAVTLGAGDDITCTLTNNDDGVAGATYEMNLTKVVVGGGPKGPDDFTLTITDGSGNIQNAQVPATGTAPVSLAAGTYTIGEIADADYTMSVDCDPSAFVSAQITLGEGEPTGQTCIVTNTYTGTDTGGGDGGGTTGQALLIIRKLVINDNGGQLLPQNFPLTITDSTGATTVVAATVPEFDFPNQDQNNTGTISLNGGTYQVGEQGVVGYDQTDLVCTMPDGTTNTGVFTVDFTNTTDEIDCLITNNDNGQQAAAVTLQKIVVGGTATPADFTLTLNPATGTAVSATPSATTGLATASIVANTAYTLTETGVNGYGLTSLECTGTAGTFTFADSVLTAQTGTDVVCTYTNTSGASGGGDNGGGGLNPGDVPGLSIEKGVTGTYAAGEVLTYSFVITNTGNVDLTNVVVTDGLPGVGTVTCPATFTGTLTQTSSITCTAPYTVSNADMQAGQIVNTATADSDQTGPTSDTEVTVKPSDDAAIELDKTAANADEDNSNSVSLGDTLTYNFKVTNTGNVTLTGVAITDPMTGLSAVDCPASVGTLGPNETGTCTATYTVTSQDVINGEIENTASASGTGTNGGVATDTDSLIVPIGVAAGMTVDKTITSSAPFTVGQSIIFNIKVTNTGGAALTNVVVSDPLTGLNQTIASIAVGESVDVPTSYTVTAADATAGTITNVANATSNETSAQTDSVSATISAAAAFGLKVDKTASTAGPVSAGDKITFTIVVANTGSGTQTNVKVLDAMVGLDDLITTLPAGATKTYIREYTVTTANQNGTPIVNTVSVNSDQAAAALADTASVQTNPAVAGVTTTSTITIGGKLPITGASNLPIMLFALAVLMGGFALLSSTREGATPTYWLNG